MGLVLEIGGIVVGWVVVLKVTRQRSESLRIVARMLASFAAVWGLLFIGLGYEPAETCECSWLSEDVGEVAWVIDAERRGPTGRYVRNSVMSFEVMFDPISVASHDRLKDAFSQSPDMTVGGSPNGMSYLYVLGEDIRIDLYTTSDSTRVVVGIPVDKIRRWPDPLRDVRATLGTVDDPLRTSTSKTEG